jgi:DNA-binding NarL/FixJ family response regulator
VSLLLCNEELLFSEALSSLLGRRGHEVVGCPATHAEMATHLTNDLVTSCLLTVPRSGWPAIETITQARTLRPDIALIALSAESDLSALLSMLNAGADGVCLKLDGIDEIESVLLRVVAQRRELLQPVIPAWSRGALALARNQPSRSATTLTPKEHAVLRHLIAGASTGRIARELGVSDATVRTHLQHLFGKFGVHSRIALVADAVRSEIVRVDELAGYPASA